MEPPFRFRKWRLCRESNFGGARLPKDLGPLPGVKVIRR
jgi:hypothetical protein